MNNNKYEVAIIGAGPAGLSTALSLRKSGIKNIIVIEKYKFPRYKCCAGYITNKTRKVYEEFGLNIENCHYSLIKDFNIFYKLNKKQNIKNKFLFTNKNIDRVELDNEFYKLAISKGIKVIEGVTIKKHDIDKNIIVLNDEQVIKYDNLVFADGVNSYGNKYQKEVEKNIAMQLVFKRQHQEEIQIHFGVTKKGYAWVSSYNGITNVGITDVFDRNVNYKEKFQKFLKQLNIDIKLTDLKGFYTPIGIKQPVIGKNIYYVGDAVGACDPLTLSGLRYALESGKYCASAIKNNDNKIYLYYIKKLKIKFKFTSLLSKIFYLKSILFCIFDIGCRYFGSLISFAFNNFFVNKK